MGRFLWYETLYFGSNLGAVPMSDNFKWGFSPGLFAAAHTSVFMGADLNFRFAFVDVLSLSLNIAVPPTIGRVRTHKVYKVCY